MPINTHQLTKSSYVKGCQCVKALYLGKHRKDLKGPESPAKQAVLDRGHKVGKLAQRLFPGGTEIKVVDYNYAAAVEETQALIQNGQEVIYEATFIHSGVLVMVDILVKRDGHWYAYEVKSTGTVKPEHKPDIAIQWHVVTSSGLPLRDTFIVHLNKEYTRSGELDIHQLFTINSALKDALQMQPEVIRNIERFLHAMVQPEAPVVSIGSHCLKPYGCDFKGFCWQGVPNPSVWDIAGLHKKHMNALYQKGVVRFSDITDEVELTDYQRMQVECHLANTSRTDRAELADFIEQITYPLCFLDFETFSPPIPLYDNSRPYQKIPFQFSAHLQAAPGAELGHVEFLADAAGDPRRAFVQALLDATRGAATILVYSETFELSVMRDMARLFPEYAYELNDRMSRVKDLCLPFKKGHLYHPKMEGSYSIKMVLPALVPSMSYEGLSIGDGTEASNAFEWMAEHSEENHDERRKNLKEYCKLDTLAMVKLSDAIRIEGQVGQGHE